MKNRHHKQTKNFGFSGAVAAHISDEELYESQRGNEVLFIAVSSAISGLEGTYTCFGVMFSTLNAHDDAHAGMKTFVQVHKVKPETGLLGRLEPESRFLLSELLFPTMGEICGDDFGLKALCHHFHNQPLFVRMLEVKAAREVDNKVLTSSTAKQVD